LSPEQRRGLRIMKLTELAQKGRSESQLRHVCNQWGVTQSTQESYIKAVYARLKKIK